MTEPDATPADGTDADRPASAGAEPFEDAVRRVVAGTRTGELLTYGEVAVEAGRPGAARAVGTILARTGADLPWWRIVNAAGRLAPHKEREQAEHLRSESVETRNGRVVGRTDGRLARMSIYDHPVTALGGGDADLHDHEGELALIVNVASKCGLTPQYTGLENLQKTYGDRGFTVLGFPCNQFMGQEPGTADEIRTFCSTTYGVTFPLFDKIDVNGDDRHPLYAELTETPDADGEAGDVQWNFEKFLVAPGGRVIARFRPPVEPEDPAIVEAIEANLP